VRLSSGDLTQTQSLVVEPWPKLAATPADLAEQQELGERIAARLDQIFGAITRIRDLKAQAKGVAERAKKAGIEDESLPELATQLEQKLSKVEERLTQVKSKSGQDPLNFPPMIDNQYVELYANVVATNHRPTAGAHRRFDDLEPQLTALLAELDQVVTTDVAALNAKVEELAVPALAVPKEEAKEERPSSGGR
jgi:hypothetical protein